MKMQLLKLLEENARLTNAQLAAALNLTEAEVAEAIAEFEREGVIRGYKALIDWEKTDRNLLYARIEIKVVPKCNLGFDEIARNIMQFDEVDSVYLMSGGYDIAVTVSGRSFKEVALFVAHKLATMESVQSTATHFVLHKYKERGVAVCDEERDERQV